MLHFLERALHHRNGFVRKGAALLLRAPKLMARSRSKAADFLAAPPVLANSFPKSGTHLLDQIVAALPGCRNYGAFLSSMTSSFQFRRRSDASTATFLRRTAPGEIVRAHLFYDDRWVRQLSEMNFVHYFIMRDPRDVVISDVHYYRSINRWHRLHSMFKAAPTLDDAITLAIRGIDVVDGGVYFPDVGRRFANYEGWISRPDVFAVKFEDLTSDAREARLRELVAFFAARSGRPIDIDAVAQDAVESIAPKKSHTFRSGKSGGWRDAFNDAHRAMFKDVAGDLLIKYGYEANSDW